MDHKTIRAQFEASSIPVREVEINPDAFARWLGAAAYQELYPGYVREFPAGELLNQKALQHYLSICMLEIQPDHVVMDVASSNSPFIDILRRTAGVRCAFRQDLNYVPGVNGDRIGSNATAIPLPGNSVDRMSLHCSWEHFEGSSDVDFLREASRILSVGGRLSIIPLYMDLEQKVVTSPSVWQSKYANAQDTPVFDPRAKVLINEDIRQRQSKSYSVRCLEEDLRQLTGLKFEVHYYPNGESIPGCPHFALLGFKASAEGGC